LGSSERPARLPDLAQPVLAVHPVLGGVMLAVPLWGWVATVGAILALIVLDFVTVSRNPHEVSMREGAVWSILYIGIALVFGVLVWAVWGGDAGAEYLAGWLVEKSLSVDNLFVFVIIMTSFAVPSAYQHRVLLFGVTGALAMRAVFIAAGAAAIQRFAVTFLLFGGLLIWTAVQLFRHRDQDPEVDDNALLRWARRRLPATDRYDEARLTTTEGGRRVVTPLLFVLVAIGTTDLLFALDSIPAVFGVTQEPYLVFAANAFALLGLRALYFLLRGLLDRLVYLSTGLSVILAFIGIKLILTFGHEVNPAIPHVPTMISLAVILGVLAVTTVASLLAARRDPTLRAHAGNLRGHQLHRQPEDTGATQHDSARR
jgi:tellurite resistance protein TerC